MTDLISLQSGTELVGDYRINRVLGAGGFGITYLAEEIALDRRVTIKEYFPSDFAARSDGADAVPKSQDCSGDYRWGLDRFIEEAQTLARFDHPNIVRVYRYFRANNTGYMVLNFEEGQSLKSWLKGLKRAPRQKELDAIVPDLLDALELIHSADFLHRDIAPDNIIIRKDGQPVLIDFGSARGEIASHSKTVSALVKPGYSPYEQYAETSRQQGPWTDIYALAATLYHAVTGKRPPDSPSRMVNDEIIPACEAAIGGYRKGFLAAIDSALKLKIDARPKSVAVWRRALMAPDPQRKRGGWRSKTQTPARPKAAKPKAAAERAAPAAPGQTPAAQHAAPGGADPKGQDAKAARAGQRAGGLIDFLDGLKSRPVAHQNKKAAAAKSEKPAAPKAERARAASATDMRKDSKSGRLATLWKRLKTSPNPIQVKAKPQVAEARPVPTPKAPRPRRIARRKRQSFRPVMLKLLIGVGAASAAVALQDRFPWPNASATSPLTTASIKTAKPQQQKQPRPERTFSGHTGTIHAAAYADEGRLLVTIGEDGTLKTWDAATGAPQRTVVLTDGAVLSMAARGTTAVTGHQSGTIALWNLTTGNKLATFKRNDAEVWSVAFADSDTRIAAASHDWKIALWDVESPDQPVHVFEGHKNSAQVVSAASTARSTVIATGSADKTVKLWDTKNLRLVRTYRGHRDFINRVVFSPDGRTLATASIDGNIRVWSTRSRRLYRSYKAHSGAISGLSFAADGRTLISAGEDGQVRIWDIKRRNAQRTLTTKADKVKSLAYWPTNKRLAVGDTSGRVHVWSLAQDAKISAK